MPTASRLLAALFGEGWAKPRRSLRDRDPRPRRRQPAVHRGDRARPDRARRGEARRPAMAGRGGAGRTPAFRPPFRRCCSPGSTGCRTRCAGSPRRPRSSARASTRALLKAVTADPARLEAGLELLCDAEIIEEVAGAGSISSRCYRFTQTLLQDVIYQNLLLQRRIEMHGQIGCRLRRPVRRQSRTARGSDRARPSFRAQRGARKGSALPAGGRRPGAHDLRQ